MIPYISKHIDLVEMHLKERILTDPCDIKAYHACALVYRHKIINISYNENRTYLYGKVCPSIHAEVNSLRQSKRCILWKYREKEA